MCVTKTLVTRKPSFPSTFPILLHHIVFSGFFRATLKNETCFSCRQHNNNCFGTCKNCVDVRLCDVEFVASSSVSYTHLTLPTKLEV